MSELGQEQYQKDVLAAQAIDRMKDNIRSTWPSGSPGLQELPHKKRNVDMQSMIIGMLLKGLGPLDGYKTYIGLVLVIIDAALRYFDNGHQALDVIASVMVGLGLGDRMGKERALNGKKPVKKKK